MTTKVEERMLEFPCDFCGMGVGTWCRVPKTGKKASHLHVNRFFRATAAGRLPQRK